jgi:hypothetical protein
MKPSHLPHVLLIFFFLLSACSTLTTSSPGTLPQSPPTSVSAPASPTLPAAEPSPTPSEPTATQAPIISPSPTPLSLPELSILLGEVNQENGISLDQGGDVDTKPVSVGNPALEARQTGNARALPAQDKNTIPDSYIQFQVDDRSIYAGDPTPHLRIEVEYLDVGRDGFHLQYDALPGNGDGLFKDSGAISKQNTGLFQTAVFNLCDANFANRDNGADFRLSDDADGAESFHQVRVIALPPGAATLSVDDYGANPFDDLPDSSAIQAVLDQTCSGATVQFTSASDDPAYQGYWIDKTLFLTGMSAKHDLTFTSSDPTRNARLRATADLKGYVVRLFARSRFGNSGDIDNITFSHIDVDGNRSARVCFGSDDVENGRDDNYGSWLPECSSNGDPWCTAGNIGMDGAFDPDDPAQNFTGSPGLWTTNIVVENLVDSQVECGSGLTVNGAAFTIRNVTIDTAGDHVHVKGCTLSDPDESNGAWSDGMTITGPGHTITQNTVINPSDIGIVFFGGKDMHITKNSIQVTSGKYGAFAGIAVHSWWIGDNSGLEISGNRIVSAGDEKCGGLHTGINLGPHMWGGACVASGLPGAIGNINKCEKEPDPPQGTRCSGKPCQVWTSISARYTLTLKDNYVSGAQINYLIEGLDLRGELIDENNLSETPRLSDWQAAKEGCDGVRWKAFDKVAHHPSLQGWTDLRIHCER